MISRRNEAVQDTMNIYSVRFGDTELIARNSRDFARIAVFAHWYTKTCSTSGPLQCSLKRELPSQPMAERVVEAENPYPRLKRVIFSRLSSFVNKQIQLMEKWV